MKFTKDLSPYADFHNLISRARTLTVKVNGKAAEEFDLSIDATGHATLEVDGGERKARPAKKAA